jgi:eukaryotic-like serine/threonine-protein kinase
MAPEVARSDAGFIAGAVPSTWVSSAYSAADFEIDDPRPRQPSAQHRAFRVRRVMPPSPPSPPTPEQRLNAAGFNLIEPIAEDVHGKVYRAIDKRKRSVVVLVLKKPVHLVDHAAFAELEKELTRLKHPAIVPILKLIGDSRSGPVIAVVSEHVVAPTLTLWLGQGGQPDLREAAFFVLVIAEALEYAGRQFIMHANLTPGNILIGNDGKPRITGFGLARLDCGPDVSCATARVYIAPEDLPVPDGRPTAQADIYSLGVIFYRLLTGELPDRRPGSNPPQSPRAINPRIPVELEEICKKAVAPDTTVRYSKPGELVADLRGFLGIKKR